MWGSRLTPEFYGMAIWTAKGEHVIQILLVTVDAAPGKLHWSRIILVGRAREETSFGILLQDNQNDYV